MVEDVPNNNVQYLERETLTRSRDLLLALSHTAQSAQQASTAEDFYRAVGKEIKSLGGDITLLKFDDDRRFLSIVYTSYSQNLLRKAEKMTGLPARNYRVDFPPQGIYADTLAGGTALIAPASRVIAEALPEAIRSLTEPLMRLLKLQQGILVPLRVENDTLGLLTVSGLSLNEEDVHAMSSFAGQIAAGLHNLQLMQNLQTELSARSQMEETLNHNRDLLLALGRAAQAIQLVRSPAEIYRVIGEQIKALGYEAAILSLDKAQNTLCYSFSTLPEKVLRSAEKLAGLSRLAYCWPIPSDSIYGQIVARGQAEYIPWTRDLFAETLPQPLRPLSQKLMDMLGLEHGIIAPLHVDEATLGVLLVFGSPKLSREDLPAMDSFAGQVAISLRNARLLQQMQDELSARKQAEESLRHSRNLLLALGRASQSVQKAHTAEEIFRVVGEQIKTLGYETTILTLSSDHKSLCNSYTTIAEQVIRFAEQITGLSAQNYRWSIAPHSIYSEIITKGEAKYIPRADDLFAEALPKSMRSMTGQLMRLLGTEHGILAPLHVDEENLGLLVVFGNKTLSTDDLPAVDSFAGQVAISLRNARLAQQVQVELRERKQAEDAVRQAEKRFKALIEKAPDGIVLVGLDGKTKYASPSARNIFNYGVEDDPDNNPLRLVHPDDLALVLGALNDLVQDPGLVPTLQYRFMHLDGT